MVHHCCKEDRSLQSHSTTSTSAPSGNWRGASALRQQQRAEEQMLERHNLMQSLLRALQKPGRVLKANDKHKGGGSAKRQVEVLLDCVEATSQVARGFTIDVT